MTLYDFADVRKDSDVMVDTIDGDVITVFRVDGNGIYVKTDSFYGSIREAMNRLNCKEFLEKVLKILIGRSDQVKDVEKLRTMWITLSLLLFSNEYYIIYDFISIGVGKLVSIFMLFPFCVGITTP